LDKLPRAPAIKVRYEIHQGYIISDCTYREQKEWANERAVGWERMNIIVYLLLTYDHFSNPTLALHISCLFYFRCFQVYGKMFQLKSAVGWDLLANIASRMNGGSFHQRFF